MIFGYVRVSSKEQNEERQIIALRNYCSELEIQNIYIDKESGKDYNRENYQKLKSTLRSGDVLIIKELDRLGRNKQMVKDELDYFRNKKIRVKILNIPTTLMDIPEDNSWIFDMINNILVEVLAAMAEEERNKIKTRQAEGIAIAKEQGKYKGRPLGPLPDGFERLYKQWKEKKITAIQFTKLLNLKSRTTLYKYINRYEESVKHQ